jgi:hypothetical protein
MSKCITNQIIYKYNDFTLLCKQEVTQLWEGKEPAFPLEIGKHKFYYIPFPMMGHYISSVSFSSKDLDKPYSILRSNMQISIFNLIYVKSLFSLIVNPFPNIKFKSTMRLFCFIKPPEFPCKHKKHFRTCKNLRILNLIVKVHSREAAAFMNCTLSQKMWINTPIRK